MSHPRALPSGPDSIAVPNHIIITRLPRLMVDGKVPATVSTEVLLTCIAYLKPLLAPPDEPLASLTAEWEARWTRQAAGR